MTLDLTSMDAIETEVTRFKITSYLKLKADFYNFTKFKMNPNL